MMSLLFIDQTLKSKPNIYFFNLFQILEDLIRLGGFLVMPEFIRGGRQLTDQQAKSSLEIAVQRVHVEVA